MKHNPADKPKIIVLSIILAAVLAFIAIRYVQLSREWKGRIAAHEKAHEMAAARARSTETTGPSSPAPSPRVAALVTPVMPPTRDPFYPIIAPRTARSGAAASASKALQDKASAPVLPSTLPDFAASATRPRDVLRVTGIITGTPSTAVLRVSDEHYVVREGDWLDNRVRVHSISESTVTLRDRGKTYLLKLGR